MRLLSSQPEEGSSLPRKAGLRIQACLRHKMQLDTDEFQYERANTAAVTGGSKKGEIIERRISFKQCSMVNKD